MAAPETNGDAATASLDAIKPPAGVVLPPREIRNVLEKTAGYVARNGAVFEDRIRDKESQNPKFSFLNPSDAYHAFYQWRLSEVKAGRGTAIAAGRAGEAASAAPEAEKPKGPPKPPDFEFSARMPRINQKDLDVIRLTALFVAKNGRQFMTQLAQRETGNPQFQFLIPNHTLHNFFQHIVDQYTTLLRASGLGGEGGKLQEERVAELEKNVQDKFRVLDRARARAEYAKHQELEKRKKEEEEEEKKAEFARIDWSDFVVVETINFTDADEQANLPPPTNLSELQYASLEDRNKASIASNMRIEEAFPGEEDSMASNGLPAAQLPHGYTPSPPAQAGYQPPAPPPQGYGVQLPERSAQQDEEERRIQERVEAQARRQNAQAEARAAGPGAMKIRENYVPRAAQKTAANRGQMALCPNCKQQIPMNELEEHMRIELLDPRWKEQKAKAETRYAVSNISHADVANNLKRLASQRSDVFDPVTGQAISEDELARRKRAAINSFDGNPEGKSQSQSGQMQSYNVEEQIRAIHEKFGDKK
ncbi:Pre-mRNA-splicing factor-like protein [Hapsidospora chrysogenum ATCC 11550]|uniref:Pre-mRNA-splicing factor-like protein n=1 Tax=Hapsidospora chrysogenum (strain ATCC 11550 / CBS 779.69 / DSM 880 / IAM 14645 / JCM 23072 / IMI 49137) TaxID=857340 RepID=A0A086T365_HAPC1|nr:Pre-mRNA-splicing factor-like protein [Hapsidospora chrysogenum ATCC 11550]